MPWQAGLTGIAYDATRVERAVGSVSELLTRKDLKGRVGLLTQFPDSVGLVALSAGADLTDLVVGDVEAALDSIDMRGVPVRSAGSTETISSERSRRARSRRACLVR